MAPQGEAMLLDVRLAELSQLVVLFMSKLVM